ncbi:hypothetical protein [Pseudobutyrivibrio sp.]|uniref:hypothetical protein n=1 Tax=Pseudobutyrivibrio sp. TaxID=2014367 RepID=UPI001D6134EA|nr:hypothetical protein [Pseudobutyrivibrio sp.]MBE5910314.1 hypothetical protein [Pseudobutyrivibrio sp.]
MIKVVNKAFLVALLGVSLIFGSQALKSNAQEIPQSTITKSMPTSASVTTCHKKIVGENIQQSTTRTSGLKYVEENSELLYSITPQTSMEKAPAFN